MQYLDILIEDPRWETLDIASLATKATQATLTHMGLDPDACEVSLLACDDPHIATLNADFRAKPTPTNVLSWPSETRAAIKPGGRPDLPEPGPDGITALGDIAISYDTCLVEATAADKPIDAHVMHLIVHGALHLLGYDHIEDADGDLMETIEVEILRDLGINTPYT